MNCCKEENKILKQDIEGLTCESKDEIVKRAWKMRDETIMRKNAVEIELAKMRIELMHVNSQLLEAIQQKVELSQQLEQWQVGGDGVLLLAPIFDHLSPRSIWRF